jgi:hypothetical protein
VAFTYSIATDRGKVRLNLTDTVPTGYVFEDDEIDYFLSSGGSVEAATAMGLRVLLADRARRARKFTLPGVTYDDTYAISELRELLKMYGADLPTVKVRMGATLDMDRGFTDPTPTVY